MTAKLNLLIMFLMCLGISAAKAESVDIKDAGSGAEPSTTIEISKGSKKKCEAMWELHTGNADLEGEKTAMSKEAKDSWKKACNDWKKEIRGDNKENKILSLSCGSSSCSNENDGTICRSKAEYSLKTRLDK